MTIIEQIEQLQHDGIPIRKLGKTNQVYNEIMTSTAFLLPSAKIKERIFVLKNNITNKVLCECGNEVKFLGPSTGYRQFCSSKCAGKSVITQAKKEKTCLTNYGVTSPSQSPTIRKKMMDSTMERFGVPHSQQSPTVRDKTRSTNLRKFGVESITSSPAFLEQRKQTSLKKYGVENPSQREEIKNKRKTTNLKKHGVEYPRQLHLSHQSISKGNDIDWLREQHTTLERSIPDIANEIGYSPSGLHRLFKQHGIEVFSHFHSSGETELYNYIQSIIPTTKIIQSDRSVLNGKELDIYIPSLNLAFEFNGVYWHSELAGKNKNYHLNKTKQCKLKGIRLIHIWDIEWTSKRQIVESRINNLIGVSNKIYARECKLIIPTKTEVSNFTNKCHIQGHNGYSHSYGLTYKGEIVSVLTIGKSRFSSNYEYELIRYTNALHTSVVGGASKLFKHFIKTANPQSVVTYSDVRWNTGLLYKHLGFEYVNQTKPNYFYFDSTTTPILLRSRQTFQKHKLKKQLDVFDPSLSEWKNMMMNGYNRIWDCGNEVYIWDKSKLNS